MFLELTTSPVDGAYGQGSVFKPTPTAKRRDLHQRPRLHRRPGGNALGGLVMDGNGNIFGTTCLGDLQSCGCCGVAFETSSN